MTTNDVESGLSNATANTISLHEAEKWKIAAVLV